MPKVKVIEKRADWGRYGIVTDSAIVEHPKYGRLYITDGWGADEIGSETYRWRHGIALKLLPDDTFEKLSEQSPLHDFYSVLSMAIAGYDPQRPVVLEGVAVEKIARQAGLMS